MSVESADPAATDRLELYTVYLGAVMMICPACKSTVQEVNVGVHIAVDADDAVDPVLGRGVVVYGPCGHDWVCGCILSVCAGIIESLEESATAPLALLAELDGSLMDLEDGDEDSVDNGSCR